MHSYNYRHLSGIRMKFTKLREGAYKKSVCGGGGGGGGEGGNYPLPPSLLLSPVPKLITMQNKLSDAGMVPVWGY